VLRDALSESKPVYRFLIGGLVATSLCATAVLAQTSKTPAKPRTPESIECSKQADAKGLKGKERKKFRAKCKKDLLKAKQKS
jgi:hypothetical protein